MIIFDLDGVLCNCDHRKHFIQTRKEFEPDRKSFYEACSEDEPINPIIILFEMFYRSPDDIEIWSGRSESVREKTVDWLKANIEIDYFRPKDYFNTILKMRPIDNNDPDEILKEMWLHDAMILEGKTIDAVFDCCPKSIQMWKRHGIFVFDVGQEKSDF